jgi:hypothetical protein
LIDPHIIISNLTSLNVVEEAFEEAKPAIDGNVREAATPPSESLDIPKNGIKWIKDELYRQIGMFDVFHLTFVH